MLHQWRYDFLILLLFFFLLQYACSLCDLPHQALAAEVTSTFGRRLAPLNLTVRELTGDMQLSKNELEETQVCISAWANFMILHNWGLASKAFVLVFRW